jgi:hypothetical protein
MENKKLDQIYLPRLFLRNFEIREWMPAADMPMAKVVVGLRRHSLARSLS